MIRFLIFALLFPAVATVAFYAVGYFLSGKAQDSGLGPVVMYLIFIAPGLIVAVIDWLVTKAAVPTVITTTLLTYGLTVAVMSWALGTGTAALLFGLICAIPAASCSWLSKRSYDTEQASSIAS